MKANIDIDDVMDAVERCNFGTDNIGFCTACGAEVDGFEPDARNAECEECGENAVFGAEELLLNMA